jgi:cytochrome P450
LFVFNTWKFHHDPAYFSSPWSFRPERFLTADGAAILRHEHFLPFGFGKRVCMGVDLAKAELFLFTATILQNIVLATPTMHAPPKMDDFDGGVSIAPRPFYVHVTAR